MTITENFEGRGFEPNIETIIRQRVYFEGDVAKLLEYTRRLEAERRWIPVTERLPEKQGHFLVWAPESFPKNTEHVVAEFYDDNNTFYSESSDSPMPDVTHWQPLPGVPS